MWNALESKRLRFMEEALTGALLTQVEQREVYEVHENSPAMQDPVRAWERQEIFFDNGSTADSGKATLSPTDSSGTVTSPVLPNIFDLVVRRYSFDFPVLEVDDGEEVNVDNNDDDENDDDFVDD